MVPSFNNAYPTAKTGKRVKSIELREWEQAFDQWVFRNLNTVKEARKVFSIRDGGKFLSVNLVYYFRRERILKLNGEPKRLDADNRIKCLLDKVTQVIGIDDCWVWQGGFYKRISSNQEDHCSVSLKWVGPFPVEESLNSMVTPWI